MATQSKITEIHDRRSIRPWRGEPVIVGKVINDNGTPEHRVVPPHKFASAGDTLVFKCYGVDTLEIKGDIFALPINNSTTGVVCATLKGSLAPGIHRYTAVCDGIEAKGASPPIVIIDP